MNKTPLQATGFEVGDSILDLAGDTHADWMAVFGQVGQWTCVAASAAGHMHIREGTPRDDACAIRSVGPWLAVAVADGAGSRPNSRYGASYAVASLCEHMLRLVQGVGSEQPPAETDAAPCPNPVAPTQQAGSPLFGCFPRLTWLARLIRTRALQQPESSPSPSQSFAEQPVMQVFAQSISALPRNEARFAWGTLGWRRQERSHIEANNTPDLAECVRGAFHATREGLEVYAKQRGMHIGEVHCTLLGLLLDTRTGALGVGQIGDGLISCLHPGLGARPLVEPPVTGNVGETYVLTQSDWKRYLAVRALEPGETAGVSTLYIMTDGVAEDCTHPPPEGIFERWSRDIEKELRNASDPPAAAVKLMRWLATYQARGSWDDRTLAVLMRDTGLAPTPHGEEITDDE